MPTKIYTTTIDQLVSIYFTHSNEIQCSIPVKRLAWEEMQKKKNHKVSALIEMTNLL
jgi:hypothetical protein